MMDFLLHSAWEENSIRTATIACQRTLVGSSLRAISGALNVQETGALLWGKVWRLRANKEKKKDEAMQVAQHEINDVAFLD